jgi:uncharacterized protein (TIRG00374 family)
MTPRARKRLFDILRVAVCVIALWIVIRGVTLHDHVVLTDGKTDLVGDVLRDGDPVEIRLLNGETRSVPRREIAADADGTAKIGYGLKTAWRNSRKSLLLLAVLIHFPVVFPQALRFQWLLAAQNITVGYWECVKLSFAGNFLNFATPFGSNAGDVFKAYFASLHTDHKTEAVTTVVLDRFIGLGSLLLVVAAITAFSPTGSRLAVLRPYMVGMIGIGVVVAFLYLSPALRKRWVNGKWVSRLPMLHQLKRVDHAARTLVGRTGTLAASVLLTIGLQAMALAAYFTVAVALAMDAHAGNMLEYFAYFYSGTLVQTLPGPPQGLGTVELTYRYFFAAFGSPSQIICMAFAVRVVVLICALPGLLVTLTGSYRPKEAAAFDLASGDPPTQPAAPKRDLVTG